jgi:hypothetical protein
MAVLMKMQSGYAVVRRNHFAGHSFMHKKKSTRPSAGCNDQHKAENRHEIMPIIYFTRSIIIRDFTRQCSRTYNVTSRRVRVTIVDVEKPYILHVLSVSL